MKRQYSLITTLLVLSLGCVGPAPEPVDLNAARNAIMAVDKAWSETTADLETMMSFFAEGARFLPPDAPQANGRAEIEQNMSAMMAVPGFVLNWSANFSDVSDSGDLGYSIGAFEMTVDGPDGTPITRNGKYTTVWKKQKDGKWKAVADMFNFDNPPGSMED